MSASFTNPVCVAIDSSDLKSACRLAEQVKPHVGLLKIGMEFFYSHGLEGYQRLSGLGVPVFLDLKLHDIPNTVAAGLNALMALQPRPIIVNVHATGGPAMLKAASDAVAGRAKLIAVTILTSLDQQDLREIGFNARLDTQDHAQNLAKLAKANGLDGVVCSPHDLDAIRQACGDDFLTIVPGIRPAGSAQQDQKRIATPATARQAGADVLVIGRAITKAPDPADAAAAIFKSLP